MLTNSFEGSSSSLEPLKMVVVVYSRVVNGSSGGGMKISGDIALVHSKKGICCSSLLRYI